MNGASCDCPPGVDRSGKKLLLVTIPTGENNASVIAPPDPPTLVNPPIGVFEKLTEPTNLE
jgi:hypothetical protein